MNTHSWYLYSLILFAVLLVPCGHSLAEGTETEALLPLHKGEAVLFMRHAVAPGFGDPPGFLLDDCRTQRNLSDEGREQARSLGAFLRERGIRSALVYSSQWCRCLETASLLDLGPVQELPALNSFFADRQSGPGQTAQLRVFLRGIEPGKPIVMVTHQVNITAITGVYPASGEMILYRPETGDGGIVLGRFIP